MSTMYAMTFWERIEKQERAGRGALSAARIAAAGIELADAEGLEGVSMRKVAGRLESGTMSLYRYVSSREELIELMADHVCAEAIAPPRTGEWRTDVAEIARISRRVALRHPWMAGHATSLLGFGPNTLAMMESTLALLDGHGLTAGETFDLWATLQSFVQGHVLEESARNEAARRADTSVTELRARNSASLLRWLNDGQHPRAAKFIRHASNALDADEAFERRLGYLLNGLARAFLRHPPKSEPS